MFLLTSSVGCLIEPRTTGPGVTPHIMEWALSHPSHKKMPYRLAYLMEAFFSTEESLFPNNCNLYLHYIHFREPTNEQCCPLKTYIIITSGF